MNTVYIWNISKTRLSESEIPLSVSQMERERINRIRDREEKRRRIGAKLLLYTVLGRLHGISSPDFQRDERGRPFLADYPRLSCGISHSGDYIMCGTATFRHGTGLGVDIEREILLDWKKLELFLAPEEKQMFEHAPEKNHAILLSRLWVSKEAYLKAFGLGLSQTAPAGIAADTDLLRTSGEIRIVKTPFSPRVKITTGRLDNYYYALCRSADENAPDVKLISSLSEIQQSE